MPLSGLFPMPALQGLGFKCVTQRKATDYRLGTRVASQQPKSRTANLQMAGVNYLKGMAAVGHRDAVR